jgi:hypothetical protein
VSRLVGALYRSREGRPAIVVGGGPSAPAQLAGLPASLRAQAVYVGANAHAFGLGINPDFIVCKDHRHTETKQLMEEALRPFGVPLVSRQHWADYRLTQWPLQGNSGMMALGLAVMMGCRPVIPVGFDCYQGATYFHDPGAKNVSLGLLDSQWISRYRRLSGRMEMAPIRAVGGPLARVFPHFDPAEGYCRPHMPIGFTRYESMPETLVRVLSDTPARHEPSVTIPAGTIFAVDDVELRGYLATGCVEIVDSEPRDMVISCAQATAVEGITPSP